MYCNRCGAPLQPDFRVCPKCGIPVAMPGTPPVYAASSGSRMERHLRTLGILWIVAGCLWLIPGLVFFGIFSGFHATAHHMFWGWPFGPPFMFALAPVLFLIAAAGICTGWGLMQREPWARIVAIIVGILVLFHFPLGTLLGIYTLWVLLSNDAAAEYEKISQR